MMRPPPFAAGVVLPDDGPADPNRSQMNDARNVWRSPRMSYATARS
jgi:hypothetical protein